MLLMFLKSTLIGLFVEMCHLNKPFLSYLLRVILRQEVEVSDSWKMFVALTVMNISKQRTSSTSPREQGTIRAMKPVDTSG